MILIIHSSLFHCFPQILYCGEIVENESTRWKSAENVEKHGLHTVFQQFINHLKMALSSHF